MIQLVKSLSDGENHEQNVQHALGQTVPHTLRALYTNTVYVDAAK